MIRIDIPAFFFYANDEMQMKQNLMLILTKVLGAKKKGEREDASNKQTIENLSNKSVTCQKSCVFFLEIH